MNRLSNNNFNNNFSLNNSNKIGFFTKTILIAGAISTTIFTTSFISSDNSLSVYASQVATPTTSSILLNNKELDFEAYTINNTTYLKLRDVAQALNNTTRQFNIAWDNETSSINIISNTSYSSIGGELSYNKETKNNTDNADNIDNTNNIINVTPTNSNLYKDDVLINLESCIINENTYFKARDLAELLDFDIEYDEATNNIILKI